MRHRWRILKAGLVFGGAAERAGVSIARKIRTVLREPGAGAALDLGRKRGICGAQLGHSGAQACGVKRVDGKGSVAALRAADAAGQERPGAASCVGKRSIHNLHKLGIARRKVHKRKHSGWRAMPRTFAGSKVGRACAIFMGWLAEVDCEVLFPVLLAAVSALTVSAACAQQARLVVDQKGDRSLAIVDPVAGKVIADVAEDGITGHEVAASPDGRLAFVPIYGNSGVGKPGTDGTNIVVIDVAAHKVVGDIDFGYGARPHCAVFGPTDGLLYVTTELDQSVTVIDPKTLKVIDAIPTGQPESHMLALSHDGLHGYTANVGPGTVSVLDVKARKTLKVIPSRAMCSALRFRTTTAGYLLRMKPGRAWR